MIVVYSVKRNTSQMKHPVVDLLWATLGGPLQTVPSVAGNYSSAFCSTVTPTHPFTPHTLPPIKQNTNIQYRQ
jgi:hypothetical protein